MKIGKQIVISILVFTLLTLSLKDINPVIVYADTDSFDVETSIKEGNDYATQVLSQPWDMSNYSQVSQYMNRSGMANIMTDLNVANGVFSGRSIDTLASFTVLFPGYDNALFTGDIGKNFPIDANKYRCVYVAAKVDTQPASSQWDQMFFWWFANEKLNGPEGTWGAATYKLYDSLQNPNPRWKLIKVDLTQYTPPIGTPWNQAPNGQWQGLFISPSAQNTTWAVDWVRLTDCDKTGHTIPIDWRGTNPVSISVQPEGTNRDILVETGVTTHPYQFDTQGLQAGKYTYFVRIGTSILSSGQFEVVDTPIVKFAKPSFSSGPDYATQAGTPWDMSPASVAFTECMATRFANGLLEMTTVPAFTYPSNHECYGGGYGNPAIELKTSTPIDTSKYRYMTFRMNVEGPWQNVPLGMIVRWIWYLQGTSGQPANRCWLISFGVPVDVGWHTYTMDLWDPHQGGVDDSSILECPPQPWAWRNASPALEVRIKPNENIMSTNLTQQLDWVRLTQPETVKGGDRFSIRLTTSKEIDPGKISLYYTTNRSNPTMHPINPAGVNAVEAIWPFETNNNHTIFLPSIRNGAPGPMEFLWNTTRISPGDYYICAIADDGFNAAPYCSEATVTVTQ